MKHLARLLAVVTAMVLCLTACGGTGGETSAPTAKPTTTTAAAENTEDTASTTAGEETTTSHPTMKTTIEKATTTRTKNIQQGITAPSTTTSTTKDKSKGKAIKILGVGNSFTVDSMRRFLFGILESAGYTDITLGYLHIGGCSLDTHYDNLTNNKAAYEYWKNTDDDWVQYTPATAKKAFGEAKWDVVTIQQVSSDSGRPDTYKKLEAVVDMLRQSEPQAKILWHMTWA